MRVRGLRYLFLLLPLVSVTGCASLRTGRGFTGTDPEQIDPRVLRIERILEDASARLDENDPEGARILCDRALEKLLSLRGDISSAEYERLHTDAALIRVKASHERRSKYAAVESDLFPLIWNTRVEKWINHFTGRGRENFKAIMERSACYVAGIIETIDSKGMSRDLLAVPAIESGYNPFARSRVGAVGLWQFMEATGREMGLRIDDWVDERRDPCKSTVMALRMLNDLYTRFGSWELAFAAYNYGPTAVSRRIRRFETEDYWELFLPRETEEFVPKIMAAIFIIREPELFGFEPFFTRPRRWKEYTVEDAVDLRAAAEWAGVNVSRIQGLNPELTQMCTPPGERYSLRLPEENFQEFVNNFEAAEEKFLTRQEINRRVRRVVYHRVSSGDSLWSISRRYNVSINNLRRWNNLRSDTIYPRQRLKIYTHGS